MERVGLLITAIHNDEERARREAAAQIAFYSEPGAYGPMLELSGFGAEAAAIRAAFAAGDHQAMVDAVSDRMIDAMAAAGTATQVRASVDRRASDFDHLSLYSPSFKMTPDRVRQNLRSIIEDVW